MQNRTFSLILGLALLLCGCSSVHVNTSSPGSGVRAQLMVSTSTLPAATVGAAYSNTVTATGGTTPYAFSAMGLPSGLTINASTGAITGTPASSAVGTVSVTVTVTDAGKPQQTASTGLSLTVNAAQSGAFAITTTSLPNGSVGASYYALNAVTGTISGTPTATGTASVGVSVTDSTKGTAQTATATLSLTIVAGQAGTL